MYRATTWQPTKTCLRILSSNEWWTFQHILWSIFQTVVFWLPLVSQCYESQTSKSAMPLRPVTIASVRRFGSYSGASQLQVVCLASYSGYVGTMLETWCYTHEKGHWALQHPHAVKQHGALEQVLNVTQHVVTVRGGGRVNLRELCQQRWA